MCERTKASGCPASVPEPGCLFGCLPEAGSNGGTDGRSGYELINRMIRAQKEQDLQQLEQEMENYLQMGYVTKELFTLQ